MMLASDQIDASIDVQKSDPSSAFQVGGKRLGPFQQDFMLNLTPCSLTLHITVDSCWCHVLGLCVDVTHCGNTSRSRESFLSRAGCQRPLDLTSSISTRAVFTMMIKLGQILKECPGHSLLSTEPLNDLQGAVQKCPDFGSMFRRGCKDIKILQIPKTFNA